MDRSTGMQKLVAELGLRFGIADLALDEDGRVALDAGAGLYVELQADDKDARLRFMAGLGAPGEEQPAGLMLELLHANAAMGGVASPYFAYNDATREVVICAALSRGDLQVDVAERMLQQVIKSAIAGRAYLPHVKWEKILNSDGSA